MADEIDRLEIAVEAEANNANRALTGLEKRLNKIADSLEKVMVMAQGGVSFKNVDIDKLFSGDAMERAGKKQGKKLADELIRSFNLNLAGSDVQKRVRDLSNKISSGLASNKGKPYKGMSNDLEELGNITAKNGQIAKSTSDEYQRLYNWLRKSGKIKISQDVAKSLGDDYRNRSPLMKQKVSSKSGTELDSVYQELKSQFPGILKDAYSVEDEFTQLESALKHFYDTANSYYKPEWLEDSAYESVVTGINDMATSISSANDESGQLTKSMREIEDAGKSFSELFGSGMDLSGLERARDIAESVSRQHGNGSAQKNRDDLKYPTLPFNEINKKFKDSTLGTDFSSMNESQLNKEIAKYDRAYKRAQQSISDMIELSGTDELGGKNWYTKIMQMNQYENALDAATEALGRLKDAERVASSDIKINRGTIPTDGQDAPRTAQLGGYQEYDSDAIQREIDGLGSATREASTFEAQIKSLKAELRSLSEAGLGQYDPQYDAVARELAEVVAAKKEYDKAMRTKPEAKLENGQGYRIVASAINQATQKANIFKRILDKLNGSSKSINSVKKSFDNVGKAIKNARSLANKAIHPFKTLKSLMGKSDDGNSRGMNLGRMVGSSVLFSSVFGMIGQIKSAIKEGSDNLVQYSSEYNHSISSMVSSLLYLKNAWAAAFAPIANVVAPYISSFIDMVASALNAVGQFMAALTGKGYVVQAKKAWKDYGASVADTSKGTNKANDSAKKLQKTILGFDELNVLNSKDDSSSGSGSGSSGKYDGPSSSEMFETIEVPNSMSQLSEKFKEAIASSDFTEIGSMVGNKLSSVMESIPWNNIYQKAENFGTGLATFLNGLISPRLFYNLGSTIASAINTGLHSANAFAINFDWSNLGASLSSSVTGFFETWDAKLSGETFGNFAKGILKAAKSAIDGLKDDGTFKEIGKKIADFICGIDWLGVAWDLGELFVSLNEALLQLPLDLASGFIESFAENLFGANLTEEMKTKTGKTMSDIASFLQGTIGQLNPISEIANIVTSVVTVVINGWNLIQIAIQVVPEWFKKKFDSARKNVNRAFESVGAWFGKKKEDIQNGVAGISDWMKEKFGDARDLVNSKFEDIGDWFGNRKEDIQNAQNSISDWFATKYQNARTGISDAFQDVGSWFGQKRNDIQGNMANISSWFSEKYQNARTGVNNAFNSIGSWFGNRRSDIQNNMQAIVSWFQSTFRNAYNAITGIFDDIGSYFSGIADKIKTPIRNALNGVIRGVNWVLGKLGSGTRFSYVNFATGTNPDGVPRDTIGMVNDQVGGTYREMVQFPNGKTIIPKGRNVMLPMPKGTKVLPADKTKALMDMKGIPRFKSGVGTFNLLDYIGKPRNLMQYAIDKFVSYKDALEPGLSMAKGAVSTVFDSAVSSIKGLLKSFGEKISSTSLSSGVERWRNLAKTALLVTGVYSESNLNALLNQMQHESGGNPNAINLWDSNAKKGTPSKGLMQVIDPTFRRWAIKGYNTNIYDPLSNMIAAIRYTVSRYGSLYAGWTARGYKGYANGGMPLNGEVYVANENGFGSEYIGRMGNNHVVANNQQIIDGIKQGVVEAMMEVYIATTGSGSEENIPIILNAVLKTEDNEVLARAVEKGQISRNSRFNPSPVY